MIVNSHNWKVQTTSTNDSWGTPLTLFNTLDSLFHFTFDCCASKENTLCEKYSTDIENERIAEDEVLWCNPPYSRGVQAQLTTHLINKTKNPLVLLVPARPATKLWQENYFNYPILFLKSQLKFQGAKHNAPFASSLIFVRCDSYDLSKLNNLGILTKRTT